MTASMLGRIHKGRALVGALSLLAFVVLIHHNFIGGGGGYGKITLKSAFDTGVMTKKEFNAELAAVEHCPVCQGQDACAELARPDLAISRAAFSGTSGRLRAAVHQVYHGNNLKYVARPIASWPLLGHAIEAFEDYVCRNSSYAVGTYTHI